MKKLFRSFGGKLLLFLLCILFLFSALFSAAAIWYYANGDGVDFYGLTEEEVKKEFLIRRELRADGENVLWRYLQLGDVSESGGVAFLIRDRDGNVLCTSETDPLPEECDYRLMYEVIRGGSENPMEIWRLSTSKLAPPYPEEAELYEVLLRIHPDSPVGEKVRRLETLGHLLYRMRYDAYALCIGSTVLFVVCFALLMRASGRSPESDELREGVLDRIPFDLMLAVCAAGLLGAAYVLDGFRADTVTVAILSVLLAVTGACVLLGLCMCAASRIKRRVFLKNNLISMALALTGRAMAACWAWLKRAARSAGNLLAGIPLVWKTALCVLALSFAEFLGLIALTEGVDEVLWLFLLEKAVLIAAAVWFSLCLRKLQKGGRALAAGDLAYHTDTSGMVLDLKEHGENLNGIASGMSRAVEERMKSERMKTELITNVSHDLKTPLTSVINYASLIAEEDCENENVREYSAVLLRQSEKLRRLIDDLVEASKASTGNLEVELTPCDASVFIAQAAGEYGERLEQAGLTLVSRVPDEEIRIQADGRRMWRIFDNLMNNVCKYAQPGTRVYLTLERENGNAVITLKNTSREPLDIPEEELMERFVRGDASRNTEGNGLGLSIARSLAELQHGSLRLAVDGDLFKAILTFPAI